MRQFQPPAETTLRWQPPREREDEYRLPLLLIIDHVAVWRLPDRFVETGLTILDPGGGNGLVLREFLARVDPLLIAVSGTAAARCAPGVLAHAASRGLLGTCLFHIGHGLWLRGVHTRLLARLAAASCMTFDARTTLADLIAFARFTQILKPGLPCVDYADVAAWLGASHPESPVGFATMRLHEDGSARTGPALRHEHGEAVHAPRIGAICLEASMRGFAMDLFECAVRQLRESGTETTLIGAHFRPCTGLRYTYAIASERPSTRLDPPR